MNTCLKSLLFSTLLSACAFSPLALASAPPGVSGFQLKQPSAPVSLNQVTKETPREAAMGGIERLGVLEPLFTYCHTPKTIRAPFLQLERLMKKTAITHKIATKKEVLSWEHEGQSRTKSQWVMAKEKGVDVASSCIAVEMELQQQAPLVMKALKKLTRYENESKVEK